MVILPTETVMKSAWNNVFTILISTTDCNRKVGKLADGPLPQSTEGVQSWHYSILVYVTRIVRCVILLTFINCVPLLDIRKVQIQL